jgi:hypothetical protein
MYLLGVRKASLYVQSLDHPGERRQIASDASFSIWRQDGNEIIYVVPNGTVMSIAVEGTGDDMRF